ncbi:protein LURP-one-related 8-like [Carex rostrata]
MMSEIQVQHTETGISPKNVDEKPSVFTVWQKSSMGFQGTDGFSVYDESGQLVFRVDNYSRRQKCLTKEVVLMDGDGNPLLYLRPQMFSLHDRWNAYEVEEPDSKLFSMNRYSMLHNADKAEVSLRNLADINNKSRLMPTFRIDDCGYEKSSSKIYDNRGDEVAHISRKTTRQTSVLLGDDVFTLVIQPGFDCKLVMAFVIVMDRIR